MFKFEKYSNLKNAQAWNSFEFEKISNEKIVQIKNYSVFLIKNEKLKIKTKRKWLNEGRIEEKNEKKEKT
jgi:hypothetical protein